MQQISANKSAVSFGSLNISKELAFLPKEALSVIKEIKPFLLQHSADVDTFVGKTLKCDDFVFYTITVNELKNKHNTRNIHIYDSNLLNPKYIQQKFLEIKQLVQNEIHNR